MIIIGIYIATNVYLLVAFWRNPKAEITATQLNALLGAVALAVYSTTPLFKADKKQSFTAATFFYDKTTGKLVTGPSDEPYAVAYQPVFAGVQGHGDSTQTWFDPGGLGERGLMQKGVLQKLINEFGKRDWDYETTKYAFPYGSKATGEISVGTMSPTEHITLEAIKQKMWVNQSCAMLTGEGINVPPDTTIDAHYSPRYWDIILENPDFKIIIACNGNSAGPLEGGLWGVFRATGDDYSNRFSMSQCKITTTATTRFFKKSPKLIEEYWKWYSNVQAAVNSFDWKNIDAQLFDMHSRENVWPSRKR